MSTKANPSLDANEAQLVERSKAADSLSGRELQQLVRQLRERRERIKRALRERARAARRDGKPVADTGALAKKSELVAAIERVSAVQHARNPANWGGDPVRGPSKSLSDVKAAPKVEPKPKAEPKAAAPKAASKAASKAKAEDKPKAAAKPKAPAKPKAAPKPKAAE